MLTCRKVVRAARGWRVRANHVWTLGNNHRVALSRIAVVVQLSRYLGAPVNEKACVGCSQLLVDAYDIGVSSRIKQRTDSLKIFERNVFIQCDPVALDALHAMIGQDDEIDGHMQSIEFFFKPAD